MSVVKPKTDAEKSTHTTVDTIGFTREQAQWPLPPFQRPLQINAKVLELAKQIGADGGVIPGVLTLGVLEKETWLVDGQHRRAAFMESGKDYGYADVRTCFFDSMADMAEEYVRLNSRLVNMKPDDILRGLETGMPTLQEIRRRCKFVGYGQLRRDAKSPMVSMSGLLRCWRGSGHDVPGAVSVSAVQCARDLTTEDAANICEFLGLAMDAWGKDPQYNRLWLGLNMTLCMWLFRNLVLSAYSAKTKRLESPQFKVCLMALSADPTYLEWLIGRRAGEYDRAPAYARIKSLMTARLLLHTGEKHMLPMPAWATTRA